MKRIQDLHDLFIEQLRGLYNGETLIKETFKETFEKVDKNIFFYISGII